MVNIVWKLFPPLLSTKIFEISPSNPRPFPTPLRSISQLGMHQPTLEHQPSKPKGLEPEGEVAKCEMPSKYRGFFL